MSDKTHTQEAFDMGRVAFQRGVPCVPALDGDYLKHLFPTLGENVEATTAWVKGWVAESFKEPTT